jgi:hypothetical protein
MITRAVAAAVLVVAASLLAPRRAAAEPRAGTTPAGPSKQDACATTPGDYDALTLDTTVIGSP